MKREKIDHITHTVFPQSKITAIRNIGEGIASYMLCIFLENPEKEIVLKVLDPGRTLIFEKELGFTFYAETHNLCPVPHIIFYDSSKEILNEDYYIYEFIEKESLTKAVATLSLGEKKTLFADIGTIVGTMHSHSSQFISDILFDEGKIRIVKRTQSLFPKIREDYQWLLTYDLPKDKDFNKYREQCKMIFRKYTKFVQGPPKTIGFTHNDLSGDNIIVKGREVASFIDFDWGGFSDTDWELARCERRLFLWKNSVPEKEIEPLKKAFLTGYTSKFPISEEYYNKRAIYLLVQIMDDMGMYPDFCRKLSNLQQVALKETLLQEMETLISEYLQ